MTDLFDEPNGSRYETDLDVENISNFMTYDGVPEEVQGQIREEARNLPNRTDSPIPLQEQVISLAENYWKESQEELYLEDSMDDSEVKDFAQEAHGYLEAQGYSREEVGDIVSAAILEERETSFDSEYSLN